MEKGIYDKDLPQVKLKYPSLDELMYHIRAKENCLTVSRLPTDTNSSVASLSGIEQQSQVLRRELMLQEDIVILSDDSDEDSFSSDIVID